MVISKVPKYSKTKVKTINLNIDLLTYDILCRYVLQPSSMVRMEHLVNLRKMINIIDSSTYENDPDKTKRVNFIYKALEARLDNNINDRDIILSFVNGGLVFPIDFLDYNKLNLSRDEIIYVHNLVAETLQYQFIYNKIDEVQDICTRFKNSDFASRGAIVQEFESTIDGLKNDFRHSRINDNIIDMTFSLRPGVFESAITNTWNKITDPSRRLICGMQGLNEMLGGGFEAGRVYLLLGTSGVGKSITLLNLIYQMKKFNTHYKTKDPTKTPCIVLLTMENTVVETITRLFDLVIEDSMGMGSYSVEEVIRMLRTEGELVLNNSSPIDIVIKYKPNRSVDTSYLYTLCDDLEDDGYEVICLVQDHMKRIRSMYPNSDYRLELGDIVNEFKVFAADKDIPVLSNTHLNREATRITEDAARKRNQDAGKLLGKSNTGESLLITDNLDCGITITLDFDRDENRFMTFNLVKMRDKTERTYIAQPFVPGSKIRLVEDIGGIPQFRESLHVAPDIMNNTCIKVTGASAMYNNIDDVIDIQRDDVNKRNAFSKQTYSLEPEPIKQQETTPGIIKPIEFVDTYMDSIEGFRKQSFTIKDDNSCSIPDIIHPIEFSA